MATSRPGAPQNLHIISPTETSLELDWNAASGTVTAYGLEELQAGAWKQIGQGSAQWTSWVHKGLQPNTKHTYRVRAQNRTTWGTYSNTASGATIPTAVQPSDNPSGQAPILSVPGYALLFADDFTDDVLLGRFPQDVASKWGAYPYPWGDTSKHGKYDPGRTTSVHNSVLDQWIHTVNGEHLVSAPCPRLAAGPNAVYGGGITRGRFAIRYRADVMPLYKQAWLLWPDSGVWPRDGEIDFPETDFLAQDYVSAFMHRMNGTSGGDQDAYRSNVVAADGKWHTCVIEWRPDQSFCRFEIDGVTIGRSTARIPNTPMHMVIQTETALLPAPEPDDATAGHVLIDWLTIHVPA